MQVQPSEQLKARGLPQAQGSCRPELFASAQVLPVPVSQRMREATSAKKLLLS